MKHYPLVPESIAKPEFKKALGAALHYLSVGENPKKLPCPKERRKTVRVSLNDYEEECLVYLLKKHETIFPTKNDVFIFCFQFVAEESKRWPQFLNARV